MIHSLNSTHASIPNCLLCISTWRSYKHFKISMSKPMLLIFSPQICSCHYLLHLGWMEIPFFWFLRLRTLSLVPNLICQPSFLFYRIQPECDLAHHRCCKHPSPQSHSSSPGLLLKLPIPLLAFSLALLSVFLTEVYSFFFFFQRSILKSNQCWTSLVVQWLRLCPYNKGDKGLIPGLGPKILHAMQGGKKKKKKRQPMSFR